jgi:hypothetical protein
VNSLNNSPPPLPPPLCNKSSFNRSMHPPPHPSPDLADLCMIAPKRLRFIGWLQRRALMKHSAAWASCTSMAMALIKMTLKRCGCSSLLPPKDILKHCTGSLSVTSSVAVFARARRQPFAGTGAPNQRVTLELQLLFLTCVRDAPSPLSPPPIKPRAQPPKLVALRLQPRQGRVTCNV